MSHVHKEFSFSTSDFERVRKLIHARAGISLSDSKEDLVYSRLSRRIRVLRLKTFSEYLDYLEKHDGEEWTEFTNALTTNLTSFFREPHHFEILKTHLLAQPRGKLVLWSAACSTGEEAYSMAITACEAFGRDNPPVEILATDLDTHVLEKAETGIYSMERIAGLSTAQKNRFFLKGTGPHEGMCRVRENLRRMVNFRQLNLLDSHLNVRGPFAAVFCRNVMIYFDKPTQYRILTNMLRHVTPESLFFMGHSESFFHATDLIQSVGKTVYKPLLNVKQAS